MLDETAGNLLKDQIDCARKIKAQNNQILIPNDVIFINAYGKSPYSMKWIAEAIRKVACQSTLFPPHTFRHMFATYALANGVDGLALQKYLGHANLSMTDYYAESSIASGENIVNLTEKFRGELGQK